MIADLAARLQLEGQISIDLKVIPKSSRNDIAAVTEDGALKVRVTAAPENGKANAAVCEVLAKAFEVPKRNVQVVRGGTSRNKHAVISL